MMLPLCEYREGDGRGGSFRCLHPQVHARRGVVSRETCRTCQFAGAASRSSPHFPRGPLPRGRAREGDLSSGVIRVWSSPDGRLVQGRVQVRPGKRTVYSCDVVIAYHRQLEWLPAAIESILSQQSVTCELHLVNDASPEDDRGIRRRYAALGQVHWYRNQRRVGPYRSLHGVWHHLRAPYLAIQDADDISLPLRLWCSIRALEVTGCDLYGAAMEQFLDWSAARDARHRRYVAANPYLRSRPAHGALPGGNIINGTMVCRRTSFAALNGFADYFRGADTEFVARAHAAGMRVFFDDRTVGLRRVHDGSLSRGTGGERDTDQARRIRERIESLNALADSSRRLAACQQHGALLRHGADRNTLPLRPVASPGLSPRDREARLLVPAAAQSAGYQYLAREGFAEPDAQRIPAVLPLTLFPTVESFLNQLGKHVRRDERLSIRRGHYCRPFVPGNHAPDMLAIAHSRPVRQGRPLRDTVSGLFAPHELQPEVRRELPGIPDPQSYSRFFGLFEHCPGHRQGQLQLDERLLAFIQLTRKGDQAFYTKIMGHSDRWRDGIMFALHLHVMRWLLQRDDEATRGIQLLMYSAWDGGPDGMRFWKRRAGFHPAVVYRGDDAALPAVPASRGVFPVQTLRGARSAAAFFCAAFGGQNDVIHYQRAGIADVWLVDRDFSKLAQLQRRSPAGWHFYLGDAFGAAEEFLKQRTFDIVSCDAWSSQFELIAGQHFATFFQLAQQYLLLTVVPRWAEERRCGAEWFHSQGLDYGLYTSVRDAFSPPTSAAERLSGILTSRHGSPVSVVDVVRRTDYAGGCYWVVIQK